MWINSHQEKNILERQKEILKEKHWSEHKNPTEKTEPARHLSSNISHLLAWKFGCFLQEKFLTREKLEALIIAVQKHHSMSK